MYISCSTITSTHCSASAALGFSSYPLHMNDILFSSIFIHSSITAWITLSVSGVLGWESRGWHTLNLINKCYLWNLHDYHAITSLLSIYCTILPTLYLNGVNGISFTGHTGHRVGIYPGQVTHIIHSHTSSGNLDASLNLYMDLFGLWDETRKPREDSHTNTGRICKLHTERHLLLVGFEPRTFLHWAGSVSCTQ